MKTSEMKVDAAKYPFSVRQSDVQTLTFCLLFSFRTYLNT